MGGFGGGFGDGDIIEIVDIDEDDDDMTTDTTTTGADSSDGDPGGSDIGTDQPEPGTTSQPTAPIDGSDTQGSLSLFDMGAGGIGIYQSPIPGITLFGRTILLFAPFGVEAWSIVNLILGCIIGVLCAAIVAILAVLRKRRERKEELDIQNLSEGKQQNLVMLTAAIGMGIAGAFLFALIQDMSRLMVIIDMWTITHTVIIAAQVIAIVIIFKHDKKSRADGKSQPALPA